MCSPCLTELLCPCFFVGQHGGLTALPEAVALLDGLSNDALSSRLQRGGLEHLNKEMASYFQRASKCLQLPFLEQPLTLNGYLTHSVIEAPFTSRAEPTHQGFFFLALLLLQLVLRLTSNLS
jgi:hypothetical protein